MRHERLLLTIDESRELITEINRWCRKTGTNYNRLVIAAGVRPSLRSSVRRGTRLTITTAQVIRSTMAQNPLGIDRDDHKRRVKRRARDQVLRQQQREQAAFPAEPIRVDRTPCPRCGVRKDIGCRHWEMIGG